MQDVDVSAELTAKNGNEARGASVKMSVGENLEELGKQFGPEVVFSHARRSIIIAMQTSIRSMLENGKNQNEITAAMGEWKPGVKRPTRTAMEKVRDEIQRMSPEDRKRILKELREKASHDAA